MILGRFIFGLGGESLGIASSIIINKWFVGKELSFANVIIYIIYIVFKFKFSKKCNCIRYISYT